MTENKFIINKIFDSDYSRKYDLELEEFILIFIHLFKNNVIKGKTRFQKLIYLINFEYKIFKNLKYYRYYYGPYSDIVDNAIKNLRINGFIDEEIIFLNEISINFQINIKLLDKGIKKVDEIKLKLGNKIESLENVIKKAVIDNNFHNIPFKDLINIVYEKAGYQKNKLMFKSF